MVYKEIVENQAKDLVSYARKADGLSNKIRDEQTREAIRQLALAVSVIANALSELNHPDSK